jgi:hypothetical protein
LRSSATPKAGAATAMMPDDLSAGGAGERQAGLVDDMEGEDI